MARGRSRSVHAHRRRVRSVRPVRRHDQLRARRRQGALRSQRGRGRTGGLKGQFPTVETGQNGSQTKITNAMRLLRNLPIRRKLTVIMMLTSGLALLLACGAFVIHEQLAFRQTMVDDVVTTAKMVGDNNSAAVSFNDPASAEKTMKSLVVHTHIESAAIYDADGKVFATYQRQ